jgi:biotin-(acetyl-CoA carboxylase) ligase
VLDNPCVATQNASRGIGGRIWISHEFAWVSIVVPKHFGVESLKVLARPIVL